jgi:pectate lyase
MLEIKAVTEWFFSQVWTSEWQGKKVVLLLLLFLLLPYPLSAAYQGFGSTTPGGTQGKVFEVTSLEDSGPGTLREAITKKKEEEVPRRIVFRVSGTIHLQKPLKISQRAFMTIDGSTAPGSGITLTGYGVGILGSHDVVVTHIRVRRPQGDGIMIKESHHIVIDHCSLTDASDENISITQGARDVTVSWCLIGDTRPLDEELRPKGMLIANFDKPAVTNVSLHHNLFANESQRSPQVSTAGLFDIRNNVVWNWQAYGIRIRQGAWGNIINNVFRTDKNPEKAIMLTPDAGQVYVKGNVGPDLDNKQLSTARSPFAVARVSTDSVTVGERQVLRRAGATPRDAVDAALVKKTPLEADKRQRVGGGERARITLEGKPPSQAQP